MTNKKPIEKTSHVTDEVFSKLKTHFEKKKVDAWQVKWLAVPANRKKYEKLADAPEVVGEELVAVTNDIIDFIQGEEGGKSEALKKLKTKMAGFFRNPISYLQQKAAAGKTKVQETASKPAEKAKPATAGKVSKPVAKKAFKPAKK